MKDGRLSYFIKLAVLFVIYFASGKFGLHLSSVNNFAAPIWPPSGIALAAIFLLGYRFWPAIAVGATLVNFTTGASFLTSAGIGAGNTLEALASAYLLNNFTDFRSSLQRLRDVTAFIILASFLATVLSATIGTTTLLISQNIHLNDYGATWRTWWMGDALGILVLAPLIFVWYNARLRFKVPLKRILEAAGLTLGLILIAIYVFSALPAVDLAHFRFGYLIFPVLIVIALRFGQLGSVTAVFAIAILAIWFTTQGFGPFAASQLNTRLAYLQTFLGVTSITFLVMASVVSEQIATQKRQVQLLQEAKLLRREQSRLKTITKAQDEFTSLASHQLRTPATAVKQYMALLLENYVGKLTKTQRTMLQRAYESNERQLKVLDDLLKVARVDLGNVRLNKEKTNLVELLEGVIEQHVSTMNSRGQTIKLIHDEDQLPAYVDKLKFGMAVDNIIDNASKYSLDGKKVDVILGKQGKKPTILVVDRGVGISKKDMPKLFKKFSRIDNPLSITVGGTGLGLYWAKKIIRLHGGTISVKSRASRGSSFKITLPNA